MLGRINIRFLVLGLALLIVVAVGNIAPCYGCKRYDYVNLCTQCLPGYTLIKHKGICLPVSSTMTSDIPSATSSSSTSTTGSTTIAG